MTTHGICHGGHLLKTQDGPALGPDPRWEARPFPAQSQHHGAATARPLQEGIQEDKRCSGDFNTSQ